MVARGIHGSGGDVLRRQAAWGPWEGRGIGDLALRGHGLGGQGCASGVGGGVLGPWVDRCGEEVGVGVQGEGQRGRCHGQGEELLRGGGEMDPP